MSNVKNSIKETFNHYIHERAVLHGLPVTVAATVATGALFRLSKVSDAALFGFAHYTLMSVSAEFTRCYQTLSQEHRIGLVVATGIITASFLKRVWERPISYQAMMIFSAVSCLGLLFRNSFIDEQEIPK